MKIILYIFFLIVSFGTIPNVFAQSKAKVPKKEKKSKKSKSDKTSLDAYFYGSKKGKKGKKDKLEKDKKGKKGSENKVLDTKSLLKDRINSGGSKTSGGTSGTNANPNETYRPVYVGNKMVTGTINSVQGFRICIYTGNNREEAMATKIKFMKKYPGVRSYMSYNTPYYKIKVGDFADKKVAQKALKTYVTNFAASFLVPDVVTVKNIMIYKNY